MSGNILLAGGAEFGGRMAHADQRAIQLAGGPDTALAILPTAAAPDHNDQRAGQNGARWFAHLGARRVSVLPLIDPLSANDPSICAAILAARFIYLLGGFPGYLGQTLAGSASETALHAAYQAGAVIGGSSAGAMVLCAHYYNPETNNLAPGLNFVPGACVIPHHNTFGKGWASRLAALLPNEVLIGIDEETGTLNDAPDGGWTVYGRGAVTIYKAGHFKRYPPGEIFDL
jgi:cyanophycinase